MIDRSGGRKSRGGYTLTELIVVLAILSVLAAAVIPSLFGFVEKAREKMYVAEAYGVYRSMQNYAIEKLSSGEDIHLVFRDIVGNDLSEETNPLYDYLTVTCTEKATVSGFTVGADGVTLSEIKYRVKGYSIRVGPEHPEAVVEKLKSTDRGTVERN